MPEQQSLRVVLFTIAPSFATMVVQQLPTLGHRLVGIVTANIIAALHSKLEGLEATRKYSYDGNKIWEKVSQQDNKIVRALVDELERLVKEGGFRIRQPGHAG